MHLVCRNTLPEPQSQGADEREKEETSRCCQLSSSSCCCCCVILWWRHHRRRHHAVMMMMARTHTPLLVTSQVAPAIVTLPRDPSKFLRSRARLRFWCRRNFVLEIFPMMRCCIIAIIVIWTLGGGRANINKWVASCEQRMSERCWCNFVYFYISLRFDQKQHQQQQQQGIIYKIISTDANVVQINCVCNCCYCV